MGITPEQRDFEAQHDELADEWAKKRSSRTLGHAKNELSFERARRLRGFHGKVPAHLRGPERVVAMEAIARRARMAGNDWGRPKPKINPEDAAEFKQFTNEIRGKVPPRRVDKKDESLDLGSILSLFKRTGKTPSVSRAALIGAKGPGVDAKLFDRLMRVMASEEAAPSTSAAPRPRPTPKEAREAAKLRRVAYMAQSKRSSRAVIEKKLMDSGLEPEPGPTDGNCPNLGMEVLGEYVNIHGRKNAVLVCRLCASPLVKNPDRKGPWGVHPVHARTADPFCGNSPAHTDKTKKTYAEALKEGLDYMTNQASTSSSSQVMSVGKVADVSQPLQVTKPVVPTPPPPKVEEPAPKPPEEPKVVQSAPKDEPLLLDGHTFLTPKDRYRILKSAVPAKYRYKVPKKWRKWKTSMEEFDLEYSGEKRLVTNRGVQEVKAPMKLARLSASYGKPSLVTEIAMLFWVFQVAAILALVFRPCPQLVDNFVEAVVQEYHARQYGWVLNYLQVMDCYNVLMMIIFTLSGNIYRLINHYYSGRKRSVVITFVPHLVSCIVSEYDRGTNSVAVKSTIRQRLRRNACLPVPAEDALILYDGTELVAEYLLEKNNFFERSPACFPGRAL